jgi:hypothetical protein
MHANRLYIPGEIREQGLALNLSMMAWRRFGLEVNTGDMTGAPIAVPVILVDAHNQTVVEIDAHPTHDGFYAMAVPIGAGRFTAGIQWGQAFECVQIESLRFFIAESFGMVNDDASVAAPAVHDGMEMLAGGLFRCAGPAALTMVPAPQLQRETDVLLHIVFRPVVRRQGQAEVKRAA